MTRQVIKPTKEDQSHQLPYFIAKSQRCEVREF